MEKKQRASQHKESCHTHSHTQINCKKTCGCWPLPWHKPTPTTPTQADNPRSNHLGEPCKKETTSKAGFTAVWSFRRTKLHSDHPCLPHQQVELPATTWWHVKALRKTLQYPAGRQTDPAATQLGLAQGSTQTKLHWCEIPLQACLPASKQAQCSIH